MTVGMSVNEREQKQKTRFRVLYASTCKQFGYSNDAYTSACDVSVLTFRRTYVWFSCWGVRIADHIHHVGTATASMSPVTMVSTSARRCLSLLAIYQLVDKAAGFVINAAFHRQPRSKNGFAFRPSTLQATIFTPDDWEDSEAENLNDLEEKHQSLGLAHLLSQEQVASLARIAVAFSPPAQALNLKNVEQVNVLSLDGSHIDIEAVVCEDESCVTLAVPVNFPTLCGEDGLEQCIIDNLGVLDVQAGDWLRELEWKEAHKNEEEWVWEQLKSQEDIELPIWWEPHPEMTEECDSVHQLLNREDYRSEVKALAIKGLLELTGESFVVQKAAVAAVCPVGLLIRAQASRLGHSEEPTPTFVELPLAFEGAAGDGDALRAAVLSTVMSASAYV